MGRPISTRARGQDDVSSQENSLTLRGPRLGTLSKISRAILGRCIDPPFKKQACGGDHDARTRHQQRGRVGSHTPASACLEVCGG